MSHKFFVMSNANSQEVKLWYPMTNHYIGTGHNFLLSPLLKIS